MADRSLPWPEEYHALEAPLRNAWSIKDLYLNRVLSGKSGALVYAVDVTAADFTGQAILKLAELGDLRGDEADEATRHLQAVDANPDYAARHLPTIVHIFKHEQQLAVLSTIAARGLEYSNPWAHSPFDVQLSSGMELAAGLLESWNSGYRIADGIAAPTELLSSWLGYRLDPGEGGRIHSFLANECNLDPEEPTLLFEGHWYPNPLSFATSVQPDELALRAVIGNVHGDLHGYNILVNSHKAPEAAYYIIDLAFYQPDAFLLFDHAYLEVSHLLRTRDLASLDQWLGLIDALTRDTQPAADDLGIVQLLTAMRGEVSAWVERHEPNRLSYLESQFVLARVAVGLTFSHRRIPVESRLKCFLYAAANLKHYLKFHNMNWPRHGQVLVVSQDEAMARGSTADALVRDAHQALAGCEWERAFGLLTEADAIDPLGAEGLESLGHAAWWSGHAQEATEAKERAFAAHMQASNTRQAGRVALELYDHYHWTGRGSVANGWLQQARRLLEDDTDCVDRGYLDLSLAVDAYHREEYETAIGLAERAIEAGDRYGDRDLQALATCTKGDALVFQGRSDEGMALIEEATAVAVSGELGVGAAGLIYCILLSICDMAGDYRRAAEWSDVADRWCARMAVDHFHGICRLHKARLLEVRGAFGEAEEEAHRAWEQMQETAPSMAASAMQEVGFVHLQRGDLERAEEAFLQAHDLGSALEPGLALLYQARGEAEKASTTIKRVLPDEESGSPWRARFLLPAQVEIAEAVGDLETVRRAAAELEAFAGQYQTDAPRAVAAAAWAVVHLAQGEGGEALSLARRAVGLWQESNLHYQAARSRLLVGRAYLLLGDDEAARLEFLAAEATFKRLGARLDLERCQRLLAGDTPETRRAE